MSKAQFKKDSLQVLGMSRPWNRKSKKTAHKVIRRNGRKETQENTV